MPIATGLALGIGAAAAAGSSAVSAIGSSKAANAQKTAAQQAQELEAQNQQKAIDLNQPYLDAGKQGLNNLSNLLKTPGQGLLQSYQPFQAPTLEDAKQNPGYQFALDTGTAALDKSAAARGNIFSGTQGTALEQFGQGLGEQNYNDVYNRALSTYGTNFNTFNTGQTNEYNRLGTLAGMGQTAANTDSSVLTNGAVQQAQQINNAGAAGASGTAGITNAISGGIQGAVNPFMDMALLSQLQRQAPNNDSSYVGMK